MQASQQHRNSGMSNGLYYQPIREVEANFLPQFQTFDRQLCYSDSSQGANYLGQNSYEQYCTLESSSAKGSYVYNSPSTVSFSPNGSPMSQQDSQSYLGDPRYSPDNTYGSPISGSCITEEVNDFKHKLKELETVMLGPDSNFLDSYNGTFQNGTNNTSPEMEGCRQLMEAISNRNLKQILIFCAKAVSDNELLIAH